MIIYTIVYQIFCVVPVCPDSTVLSPWCCVWPSRWTTSPWPPTSSSEPSRGPRSASLWWWSPSRASTATRWLYWTSSLSTPPSSSRTTTASPPAWATWTAWERKDMTGPHGYSTAGSGCASAFLPSLFLMEQTRWELCMVFTAPSRQPRNLGYISGLL